MSTFRHGNDCTLDARLFRGGCELTTQRVFRRAGSRESVTFLTTLEAEEKPRRSYAFVHWSAEEVLHVFQPSQGAYLPAEVGDVVRDRWVPHREHRLTEADLERGWFSWGAYQGVRSGRLEEPVFLRPRSFYRPGNALRASESRVE